MGWKEWIKQFFAYSKRERRGVLVLFFLIIAGYSVPYLMSFSETKEKPDAIDFRKEIATFQAELNKNKSNQKSHDRPLSSSQSRQINPFPFNPNELTREEGLRLGLPDFVVNNIIKYRKKGGRFDEPEDFARLYGLPDSAFQKLKPYIRLPETSDKQQDDAQKWQAGDLEPDTLFPFNPNDLPIKQWRKLGLSDRTILTIKNYEEQGGYFRKKADLAKIYGLEEEVFATLEPFIELDQSNQKTKRQASKAPVAKSSKPVDINSADSLQLLTVSGIGPFYAKVILEERRRLGGFVSKEQLKDVYGMQRKYGNDSLTVYQRIEDQLTAGPAQTKRIDLNTATVEQLAAHPYIDYNLAQGIVNYRKQHGYFDSLSDVSELYLVDEKLSRKLAPYLQLP